MRPLQVSVFVWDLGRESALQGREALQVVAQFGDLQHLWREWGPPAYVEQRHIGPGGRWGLQER